VAIGGTGSSFGQKSRASVSCGRSLARGRSSCRTLSADDRVSLIRR
jgi:hypothetical protein